jgi:uncharacterized phosphosugar-binding protein
MTLYLSRLTDLLSKAGEVNEAGLGTAAGAFADSIAAGGLVHLYGSGHSVLPCQEAFPRYGSYVGLNPLTDPRVMWHNVLGAGGVRELLWLERTEGYVDQFLAHQPLNAGDSLLVFGHSGRNSSGIETALYAKERGLFVVAVTCAAMLGQPASHSSGQRLPDVADVVIDTCAPIEDAIVEVPGWSRPVGGSSTVLAMALSHEIFARAAVALSERGIEMPTFASPTVPGVTLHDTDQVYGIYRERMLDAQREHLPSFKAAMSG